jgi:hypothetical protein
MAKLTFAPKPHGRPPGKYKRNTIEEAKHREPSLLTLDEVTMRNKFVEGLLLGMTRMNAAMYAGASRSQANKYGTMLFYEPYVVQRFNELREVMEEENIITRKELILNLKSIAVDDMEESRNRIGASALIAKVMGYEAPTKTANLHLIQGGVMLVPVPANPAEWEAAAVETQTRLKGDVRQ